MQHYDAVHSPTPGQLGMGAGKKNPKNVTSQAQHLSFLQQHPYDKYTEDDLEQVRGSSSTRLTLLCHREWGGERSLSTVVIVIQCWFPFSAISWYMNFKASLCCEIFSCELLPF